MIEGIVVFLAVAAALFYAVKSLFGGSQEDTSCHSCDHNKKPN